MKYIKKYNELSESFSKFDEPVNEGKLSDSIKILLKKVKRSLDKFYGKNIPPSLKKEVERYIYGSKIEGKETVEYVKLFRKYVKDRKNGVTKSEKDFLVKQSIDILKLMFIIVPFQFLFPVPAPMVGTTILIIMEYLFRKMGIKILPDGYYANMPEFNKKIEAYLES